MKQELDMRKLYEKKELLFAVLWIALYCVALGTIRGNFGDESIVMLIALLVFMATILAFVKANHLEEKYGLNGFPEDMKKYLFFIPMFVLTTGNLWDGFLLSYKGADLIVATLSMILVGFVEEMIFRGFLFKAMLGNGKTVPAIVVSAVSFGVGHIVNLFVGQVSFETVMQIIFAISWGFIFTMVFYRSGSLIPCIIAHAAIDVFSLYGTDNELVDWIYIGVTIVVAIIYCTWLSKMKNEKLEDI